MNEKYNLSDDIIIKLFEYVERRAFLKGVIFATTLITAGEILRKLAEKKKAEEE